MEQTILHTGRHTGWSDQETNLLWETADEAQQQGMPLKAVFENIAQKTGRRPNSIRNYYYAQVRERMGGQERTARFIPFTESEVMELMQTVIRDRALGKSVRSCLQRISGGDHSLMLRYQNKYRSVIKGRPDIVRAAVEKLRAEGVEVTPPEVTSRSRTSLDSAVNDLVGGAQRAGDAELVRALEAIGQRLFNGGAGKHVKLDLYRMALDERQRAVESLIESATHLISPIKEYLGQPSATREQELDAFCRTMAARIGTLEESIQEAEPVSAP